MKKFLSIMLSILMVVTMLPMAVLPASAASEAITLKLNSCTKVDYSNSATQYYQYNNYLYKAAYSNLKNISEVAIDYDRYDQLHLRYTKSDTGGAAYINLLTSYRGSFAELSNLPTAPGKSVSFYTSNTTASNEANPVVTVTCMAVSEPVWSWNGVSSATAVFTSTDGGATMTVDAAIEISEKTAENCLETDTTAYTATATANGKEYTNVKTIYGEQGPHNFEYIESGDYMIGSCTNGCGMNCTHNWTDKNDYLCDNCGFECHHESYTDGICTVCGFECAHENITDGKCDDCGEEGIVVTITMTDSYSDGWNGNGIVVKQLVDGAYTEVATATFEDGASETFTALLRQDGIYAFSWVYGEYPDECSFTFTVDGETVYECADGGTLADSEIFYIICKHTSYTDGKCDVCDYECPHENQTGSVCEICGEHICSYNNGFCTECDAYEPAELKDGYYQIENGGQLFWYANYINTVDRTANAVLTADIDLENRPWTPIGTTGENSNNFRGIFDGQNYTIRGLYVEGDRAGLGFFGEVRTGTVKNFTIFGEVVVNTEVDYVGGVIGSICGVNGENDLERNGAIIQNIKSFVNLTVKAHGVGKIGGFVGYANHQSLIEKCSWYGTFDAGEYRVDNGAGGFIGRIQENSSEVTIRNCGAYGTIKTNYAGDYNNTATIYMGGFLSFSNTSAKTTIENCLFAGRFKRGKNLTDQAFLGAFGTLRSVNAIKNCYYLGDDGLEAVHSDSPLKPGNDNVEITKATGEELKKGTVAKELGEYWEQGVHYPTLKDHAAHWGSETYGYTDNGDGTHDMVCTGCGHVEVYNEAHGGGTATCTEQAKCERCGASYGELDPDNHASDTYIYTDNGDGTHTKTHECGVVVVESEAHTIENHVCTGCGAMEIVVSFNAGDYEWKTGDQINFVREVEGIGIDDCVFTATVAEDGTVTWTADKPFCWYGEGEQKLFAAPNNGWSVDYFVIPEDQSTSAKLDEADLVNGMWVGTPTTDTVTFNMTHRMAKVTVNYEFAEGVTADISELKVYSIAQICRFSTDDWSIKLTSAGQYDVWVTPYLDGNQFTAFIIPETYATDEDFIKITLSDGTVYEVKMNKAVTFEDGGEYNYKVVITADGAYLTCADECSFEYIANEDGLTHSKVCTECGYVAASEAHSGGTATCTEQAECQHCGASYGEVNAHDWSNLDGVCANGCGAECPHDSYTDGVCDNCDYECTHEWNDGVLTRPVYDAVLGSKDGYYTYTCTVCGEEKTETVKSADYSAYEAVSEEINALLQSEELTPEAKQAIYSAANECGHLSNDLTESEQNIVDDLVVELEKIVADAEEKIASGEYVKADYTEIDEAIASVDEALENATINEEMANELSDIKSQLEALKENENTSMADAAELLERVKAVAETMADCANGIHSFTKYEETEAPECGKAGKEVASCDHGCGATDEKEIEALEHADKDGDLKCDHGCGHEFEQPVEPEQPDTPDEPEQPEEDGTICEYCGNNHNNPITRIFCRIIQFFIRLFTFLGFWE